MKCSTIGMLALAAVLATTVSQATADEFTYQGRLRIDGLLESSECNFRFRLYDAESGGTQIGGQITFANPGIMVDRGLFTAELDFGDSAFDGGPRWLEIDVACGPDFEWVELWPPRQPVANTPQANFALAGGEWTRVGADLYYLDGRVGIGTDSPEASLHLVPQGAALILDRPLNGGRWNVSPTSDGDGGLRFLDIEADLPSLFIARNSGHVGMGTDSPDHELHVLKIGSAASLAVESDAGAILNLRSGSGSDSALIFEDWATGDHQWVIDTRNGSSLEISPATGGDVVRIEQSTGFMRIGVGSSPADCQLEVNGDAAKPGGGSWSNSSDGRLKTDIRDLDDALALLLELRGVSFEYKDPAAINELSGRRMGFIAQDVEEVIPDWVHEGERGYKRTTIRGFEALAVEAIRQLHGENVALRASVDSMHDRIAELENAILRLEALEAK